MRVLRTAAMAVACLAATASGLQGAQASPDASPEASIVVEESFATACYDQWGAPAGGETFTITFTVPDEVTTGATLSLGDPSVTGNSPDPVALIAAEGADRTPFPFTGSVTVTAPAGGNVTLSADAFGYLFMGRPVRNCLPTGDAHLVTIPVVAA
jgi:hypothetical protein